LDPIGVEFSDDVVLVPETLARQLKDAKPTPETPVPSAEPALAEVTLPAGKPTQLLVFTGARVTSLSWEGKVPWQKWTPLFTKVLQRLVSEGGLTILVKFEARPSGGIFVEQVDETRQGLRELGLSENISTEGGESTS
jgi:hypothetical protein